MLVEFTHHELCEILVRLFLHYFCFVCYFIEDIDVNYLDFILFFILPLIKLIIHVWLFFDKLIIHNSTHIGIVV